MRASGILMHITSLPSPHGVGTLGREAYAFVDFLVQAGQKYWQILPLGPTGFGDSPYQSDSVFAGNPYLIDMEMLSAEGLLSREELEAVPWGADSAKVDYGALYHGKFELLRRAFYRDRERSAHAVGAFYRENAWWLRDYALFFAAKRRFGMRPWQEWEDESLRNRWSEQDLDRWQWELREDVDFCVYIQYLFFRQWDALRAYVREKGVSIIGDVPIYVPLDSADVWAGAEHFQLDAERRPIEVAGVPPDYFTADGQLWGNPLYDWDKMAADGFSWWLRRLGAASRLYDVVRIDHFRGLESYWAVPRDEATARNGRWRKGPGEAFVNAVRTALPQLRVMAEDLGFMTEEVRALRRLSGWPGMKVLQFAFDPREPSDYLPHRYESNCVCYTGTHDNATVVQWLNETAPEERELAREYLGLNDAEGYVRGILRGGMSSVAELFVAQMQDWLELGAEARMNTPGVLGHGNWRWRADKAAFTPELARRIRRMTELYGR